MIQATPFCNLDCRYCYLPDRQNTARMSPTVLDRLFARVFESDVVRSGFTVVWHAGEPLVMPPAFYAEAFAIAARHNRAGYPLVHSYQTNATLLDEAWCDFIRRHDIRIGVSLDGPAFLHDRQRVTRRGRGTHQRVMEGVARLRRHRIPFHVITVLTLDALDYPDELYAFYVEHGIERVGFNIEEIEGPHRQSSLSAPGAEQRFRQFLSRFYDLATRGRGRPCACVSSIRCWGRSFTAEQRRRATHETAPFAILSVDYRGNFGSFSPELLGLPSRHYGEFLLGTSSPTPWRPPLARRASRPSIGTSWPVSTGAEGSARTSPSAAAAPRPTSTSRMARSTRRRRSSAGFYRQVAPRRAPGQAGAPSAPGSRWRSRHLA